jgi:oligoendopeptidase F
LPKDAKGLMDWSWADFEPYYEDLIGRPLSARNVAEFLSDWTRLSEIIDETYSRLHVATTVNTADREAEQRYHTFLDEVFPPSEDAEQKLKQKLLEQSMVPGRFEVPLLKMRTEAEIYRAENLPLLIREHKLSMEYDKIIGAQTVEWDGKEITVVQLRPIYQSTDREMRERAWRLAAQRQLEDRGQIDSLWQDFMGIRAELAANAGFHDYRSYRWKQLLRFDYTPQDCRRFHDAIEEVVVPAAARICERRRKLLDVTTLRPWDMDVDPLGRPRLGPFEDVGSFKMGP